MSAAVTPLPWFQGGLRFACTQCGNCCSGAPGYVWVTLEEIERIAAHVGMATEAFQRRHVRRVGLALSLRERRGGDCEFLVRAPDGKTTCQIHAVRPVQCRTWPFWASNVSTPEDWAEAAQGCPGMNHGPLHNRDEIESTLAENGALRL